LTLDCYTPAESPEHNTPNRSKQTEDETLEELVCACVNVIE